MSLSVRARCCLWLVSLLAFVPVVAAQGGDLRLLDALRQRDGQAVAALLKTPIDVNARQADGATALHWAAHWDDLQVADALIRAGARVNAANDYGVMPIALACTNGHAAMVDRLLKAGADANSKRMTGETALMTCARSGNADAVKALLAHGADVRAAENETGQTALMWAAAQGHAETAQALIDHGADVHLRSKRGFTPLLFSARSGDVETARVLLAAGADVNEGVLVESPGGGAGKAAPAGKTTALLLASAGGHEKLAIYLLEKGADPNAWDGGAAPIHYALLRGFANSIPRANYVAYLFRSNQRELVKALVEHGANPNLRVSRIALGNGFRGSAGSTPFLLATSTEDTELMRFLVAHGADPKMTTNANVTPLMAVAGINRGNGRPEDALNGFRDALEAVKVAIELGNDIHAVDNRGQTALHGAAYTGSDPIVQYLVDMGADVNARDKGGETPWTRAMSLSNDGEIVHEIRRICFSNWARND